MALKINGYYAYIIEEEGSNVIKFGITNNIKIRYAGSSSINPRDWILRCSYFFQNASKKDLENFFEKKIKKRENFDFKNYWVRDDMKTEMLESVPYEWLEFELLMIWIEWYQQFKNSPHNLLLGNENQKLQLEFAKNAKLRMKENIIVRKPIKEKVAKEKVIESKEFLIYEKLESKIEFLKSSSTKPYQMKIICKECDINPTTSNYKIINKILLDKGFSPRRTNGKKVYDLNFI